MYKIVYIYIYIHIIRVCLHQLPMSWGRGRGAILPTATVNPQEPWGLTGGPLGDPEQVVLGHGKLEIGYE